MTGLDVFQLITSLRVHFTQAKYHYGKSGMITVKLETYYSDRNYDVYEFLTKYDRQYIEKLYISNCLQCNGYLHPLQLKNVTSHKIKEKWEETIELADQIFINELLMMMDKYGYSNPYELFKRIHAGTNNHSSLIFKQVNSIMEVINDELQLSIDEEDKELVNELSEKDIHYIIILDEIMRQYYNYSFLDKYSDNVNHPLFFTLKYKEIIPIYDIMKRKNIKKFCECL